jgi:anthranilate synthase component 1
VAIAAGNQALSCAHEVIPVGKDVDLTVLMSQRPDRYPFLLQSAASGPELSRFDILFACPGDTLTLSGDGRVSGPHADGETDFLGTLDAWWAAEKSRQESSLDVPFTGGWFLYLGYELAGEIETGLKLGAVADRPIAFATRVPVAIIVDHHQGQAYAVAERSHAGCLPDVLKDVAGVQPRSSWEPGITALHEDDPDQFIAAVNRAKDYIAAGDIFQANLSRCWKADCEPKPDVVSLYRRLCETNPAPFAGLVLHDVFSIISSSPERLVRRKGRTLDTRPIAGTRPRNEPPEQSNQRKQELLDHPKERAEHVMLIDLERNDLGRVCVGGSVRVSEYMVVESYTHVHHIVSNVTGTAREELAPGELIRAVFPGGTITGCPKVRCMEIINELEQRPRGAYTGSMGYLNLNGDCDLNILIRTITAQNGRLEFAAGSGIVADSDPGAELEETRAKAKGMLMALQPE